MTATNIEITVDFDGIVNNIKPSGGVYYGCDNYVTYSGKPVNGTTITLSKGYEYTFTLAAANGDSCTATNLENFQSQDNDLTFESDSNPLQLKCMATKKDSAGVDVTLTAEFNNQANVGCTAQWDPRIVVTTKPPPP